LHDAICGSAKYNSLLLANQSAKAS
jgi:hypothetical protein